MNLKQAAMLRHRQKFAARFAGLAELPEKEFEKIIIELETDPVFVKLLNPSGRAGEPKVIKKRRIRAFRYNECFLETQGNGAALPTGEYGERSLLRPEIYYRRIAVVKKRGEKLFFLELPDDRRYSYKYEIDAAAYGEMQKSGLQSEQEKKRTRELFGLIRSINARKTYMLDILRFLAEFQKNFILTGDPGLRKPLTYAEAAAALRKQLSCSINKSTVFRFVQNKYITLPDGRDFKLKELFLSKKGIVKKMLAEIIKDEFEVFDGIKRNRLLTDSDICRMTREKTGLTVSRRTVTGLRKEAGIPAKDERRKVYIKKPDLPGATDYRKPIRPA